MGWLYLSLAGASEIGFATLLKLSAGFTRPWPTFGFLVMSLLSLWLLTLSLRTIPLGIAYALWAGIGVAGTTIIAVLFLNHPMSFWEWFFLALMVTSIGGLQLAPVD